MASTHDINAKQGGDDWKARKTDFDSLDGELDLSILVSTTKDQDLEKEIRSQFPSGEEKDGYGIDGPWKAFRIRGPMEFHLVGVMSEFSRCLADNHVSIFAVSTWDTDYVCVKADKLQQAVKALENNGWRVLPSKEQDQ